jgi:hypothetical protein
MIRKLFVIYLALAVVTTTAVIPRRSDALIGATLISGGTAAVVLGAILMTVGTYSTVRSFMHLTDEEGDRHKHINLGMLYLFAGFITLDQNTGDMAFGEISDENAKKWNVTWDEQVAYKSELLHLNLARESILASWNAGELKTVQDTAKAWEFYKDTISPEAWSAFTKVMSEVAQQI